MKTKQTDRLERGTYIGGHDASAIIGRHPYGSAGDVYTKVAMEIRPDISDLKVIRRGTICEPGLLKWLEKTVKKKLKTDVHVIDTIPYFAGTLDAVEPETGIIHDVTVTTSRSKLWLNGPAEYKVLQLQWYMGLAETASTTISKNGIVFDGYPYPVSDLSYLTVFFADTGDLEMYPVYKNEEDISKLRSGSQKFWLQNIEKKVMPEMISENSAKLMYPKDNGVFSQERPAEEVVRAAIAYTQARDFINDWTSIKTDSANVLKGKLKEQGGFKWSSEADSGTVSWKVK